MPVNRDWGMRCVLEHKPARSRMVMSLSKMVIKTEAWDNPYPISVPFLTVVTKCRTDAI